MMPKPKLCGSQQSDARKRKYGSGDLPQHSISSGIRHLSPSSAANTAILRNPTAFHDLLSHRGGLHPADAEPQESKWKSTDPGTPLQKNQLASMYGSDDLPQQSISSGICRLSPSSASHPAILPTPTAFHDMLPHRGGLHPADTAPQESKWKSTDPGALLWESEELADLLSLRREEESEDAVEANALHRFIAEDDREPRHGSPYGSRSMRREACSCYACRRAGYASDSS